MKKIELKELKQIQLDILKYVDEFCRKNQIDYWIDCGTLLGAVRHKGYIPWDDDIDIGMLRKDYEKFMKSFNKNNNSNYKAYCYELDKNWFFPYGKVLDERTILYEPDEKTGRRMSVNIDVFVYDNAPNNQKELSKMYKLRDLYAKLDTLQTRKTFISNSKQKFNFLRYPIWLFLQIFPNKYFVKKSIINSKKYSGKDTGYVGNFTSVKKIICEKNIFESFVDIAFEKNIFKAPIGYDKWLSSFYGDYMKLPPKDKQISHHMFVAYKK